MPGLFDGLRAVLPYDSDAAPRTTPGGRPTPPADGSDAKPPLPSPTAPGPAGTPTRGFVARGVLRSAFTGVTGLSGFRGFTVDAPAPATPAAPAAAPVEPLPTPDPVSPADPHAGVRYLLRCWDGVVVNMATTPIRDPRPGREGEATTLFVLALAGWTPNQCRDLFGPRPEGAVTRPDDDRPMLRHPLWGGHRLSPIADRPPAPEPIAPPIAPPTPPIAPIAPDDRPAPDTDHRSPRPIASGAPIGRPITPTDRPVSDDRRARRTDREKAAAIDHARSAIDRGEDRRSVLRSLRSAGLSPTDRTAAADYAEALGGLR